MSDFFEQLRDETAGVRLMLGRPGVSKALTESQRGVAAKQFDADVERLRASKKLIDTSNAAYRDCTKALSRAKAYWALQTIDYPVAGIRLIRRDLVDSFDAQMAVYRSELEAAAKVLRDSYEELKTTAREQLGDLYDASDYPADMAGEFSIAWEYPNVEPPEYLKDLNPALYEQQKKLISERLELAVSAAEREFASLLQGLVANLVDRLTLGDDGKPKILNKRGIDAFETFFERFRSMKLTNNDQLNAVVAQAEKIIKGVDLNAVRSPESGARGALKEQLEKVAETVESLIVDAPTRTYLFDEEDADLEVGAVA
jgi:hypothetical protein